MISVKKLFIYPIKSFTPMECNSLELNEKGCIKGDRRFHFLNKEGKKQNAKNNSRIHGIKAIYNPDLSSVKINGEEFTLRKGNSELESAVSDLLGTAVELKDLPETGLPDLPEWPGPSITSLQTLELLKTWYPEISIEELITRFRSNLIIDQPGSPPFWEELLIQADQSLDFKELNLIEFRPCARCPVPSRDPETGEMYPKFAKIFNDNRTPFMEGLNRYGTDHVYYLSVVTRLKPGSVPARIQLNEEVKIRDLQTN